MGAVEGRPPPRASRAEPVGRRLAPPSRIPDDQRENIRAVLCEERFWDLTPAQIYVTLLDEGIYLCSERTMYRVLAEAGGTADRRRGRRRRRADPAGQATGPNQVWSWKMWYLPEPLAQRGYHLYVVLDVFSRKIVAWSLDAAQPADAVETLVAHGRAHLDTDPGQLIVRQDRDTPPTGVTLAALVEELTGLRPRSRPHREDDGPATHPPAPPADLGSVDAARSWLGRFVAWYNHAHRHADIGYLHPADVHDGTAGTVITARQAVLDTAYEQHPERFPNGPPRAGAPPAVLAPTRRPTG